MGRLINAQKGERVINHMEVIFSFHISVEKLDSNDYFQIN